MAPLTADGLFIGIATSVLALATIAIAIAAWRQLPFLVAQLGALAQQVQASREVEQAAAQRQREWETIAACGRYDIDPVIETISKRLWDASRAGVDYSKVDPRDCICILNYFDSLAIGIRQNLYIEEIVKDHNGLVISKAVELFIKGELVPAEGYRHLMALYDKWNPPPPHDNPEPAYKR
jgi:hypothetical protein